MASECGAVGREKLLFPASVKKSARASRVDHVSDDDAGFDLAPLEAFRPADVVSRVGKDDLSAFMLALAAAFNDMKGLFLWRRMIGPLRPKNPHSVSARAGQFSGIDLQVTRLLLANLLEILRLVQEFAEVASGDDVRKLLLSAPVSVRREWDSILRLSAGDTWGRDQKFARVLTQIRNNAVYHYYQPKALLAGYRTHFFGRASSLTNRAAYASMGSNMEQTRFYYADAAIQALLATSVDSMGREQFQRRLTRTGSAVNQCIAHLVSTYLRQQETRTATLGTRN